MTPRRYQNIINKKAAEENNTNTLKNLEEVMIIKSQGVIKNIHKEVVVLSRNNILYKANNLKLTKKIA